MSESVGMHSSVESRESQTSTPIHSEREREREREESVCTCCSSREDRLRAPAQRLHLHCQKLQRLICRRAGAGGGIGSLCSEQRVRMADLSLCAFCALCEQQPRSASRIVLGLK